MKILYIGSERSDAQVVATVLRSLDETVTVLWAAHLDHAVRGLDENRDLSALVVDIQVSEGSWPEVLSHARSLASHPAIVAILPDGVDDPIPGVDGCVRRSHSLPRDLPIVLTRAMEHAARVDLEQKLIYAQSALEQTELRRRMAADRLATLEAQYEVGAARAAATWEMVDEQLRTAALEVERARQAQATAAAEVDRLSRRDVEISAQRDHAIAARTAFERRLADAEETIESVRARAERDQAGAVETLAERQRAFDSQIAEEIERRQRVEVSLAKTVKVRDDAQKRHALAMTEAAVQSRELQESLRVASQDVTSKAAQIEQLITREKELTSSLADVTSHREEIERRLAATQAAFDDAAMRATRERLVSSKKAADREAELDGLLQEERTKRTALEQAIAEADASLRDAQQRHDTAVTAAADALAERQTQFDRELTDTATERDRVTQSLRDTELALDRARQDHQSAAAEVERLTQRESELTSQLTDVQDSRDTLERQLGDAEAALRDAHKRHDAAITAATDDLTDREAHFDRVLADVANDRDRLTQDLQDRDAALTQTQQRYESAATDVERLTQRETELVTQLAYAQAAYDAVARQLADTRAAAVERESQLTVQSAQEQLEHETRFAAVEERHRALSLERDSLQQDRSTLSTQVQQLREQLTASAEQLEASRLESDRLFDQAGIAMFRCTRDGAFTEVNRACASLIGRRMLDDGIDIAAAVFEDPNVLSWLIERCLTTRTRESVETTWRRPDGSRLFMRLAARSSNGIVEVVAEDLTRLRVLEERLTRAQRMEAVGRFAQEVAVTCSGLLDSLHRNGAQSERLSDDIGRAASLLRELAACGDEQARTPMQVDLNTLIRDLEPVLKRVAGGDVEVQLRDTSSPLNVDVGTERVERLLVNLAGYGRGRMPSGGRLRIELGTSVVDRRFAAKHPNVRLGLHALITVTETGHQSGVDEARDKPAARPGVDFGTLQELVSECGGHLWMKVQPPGDMVAKIRLPLQSGHDQPVPRAAARAARIRTSSRWLQS